MKVRAPGKLILSGEHAVVHGAPALAMAINRYVCATARSQPLPVVSFDFSDLSYQRGLTLTALRSLRERIFCQYQRFRQGKCRIRDVLRRSHELAQFVVTLFFGHVRHSSLRGIRIHLQSDIPVGCGMGSSAATILGVAHALAGFLHMDIAPEFFLKLGLEAENMQHGHSSGLDLQVSLKGGCLWFCRGETAARPVPDLPFYLIDTGVPSVTTGECVAGTARHFSAATGTGLLAAFSEVTAAFEHALVQNSLAAVREQVRANHALLVRIGVVPDTVRRFLHEIECQGGGGKICGAGAISGERAGVLLVVTDQPDVLTELCGHYGYGLQQIAGETRGVHAVL